MDCKSCRRPIKNEAGIKQKELSQTNSDNSCLNKMADGRAFTDYRPQCTINASTMNSYDQRMYLMKNASSIMKNNLDKMEICNCFDFNSTGTMLPEQNITKCDSHSCSTTLNDISGLGVGRQ